MIILICYFSVKAHEAKHGTNPSRRLNALNPQNSEHAPACVDTHPRNHVLKELADHQRRGSPA